jgi:hypothetical protein
MQKHNGVCQSCLSLLLKTKSQSHHRLHTAEHTSCYFVALALQVGQRFRSAAGTSGGKALLDAWGYQAGDVESLIEGLQEQQAVYAGEYGSDVEL